MESVIIDQEMQAKLNGLQHRTMFCDESRYPLGVFLPLEAYHDLVSRATEVPSSPEELERRRVEARGCSLEEIWKRLGVK